MRETPPVSITSRKNVETLNRSMDEKKSESGAGITKTEDESKKQLRFEEFNKHIPYENYNNSKLTFDNSGTTTNSKPKSIIGNRVNIVL